MSFQQALVEAYEQPHRDTRVHGVHDLMAKALEGLDPRASILATDYFAHSFVPDLVVSWQEQGFDRKRHVHLRARVEGDAFEIDLDHLDEEAPLFLGLSDAPRSLSAPAVRATLVTGAPAVDELMSAAVRDRRTTNATEAVVRHGHGRLRHDFASSLAGGYEGALKAFRTLESEPETAALAVGHALEGFADLLPSADQRRVEASLQTEWLKAGGHPDDFPGTNPWRPELLDESALRDLLLSLLQSPTPVASATWQRVASFITAERIGRVIGRDFKSDRLNEMAREFAPYWKAKRVWAPPVPEGTLPTSPTWLIKNQTLALDLTEVRLFFADDGRHFKDKVGDGVMPRLSESRDLLGTDGVIGVGLVGAGEGLEYESFNDVTALFDRLSEVLSGPAAQSYRVQTLRADFVDDGFRADIDFGRRRVELSQAVSVSALVRRLRGLLGDTTVDDVIDQLVPIDRVRSDSDSEALEPPSGGASHGVDTQLSFDDEFDF